MKKPKSMSVSELEKLQGEAHRAIEAHHTTRKLFFKARDAACDRFNPTSLRQNARMMKRVAKQIEAYVKYYDSARPWVQQLNEWADQSNHRAKALSKKA